MCISRRSLAFGVKFSGNNNDQFSLLQAVHILGVLLCLILVFCFKMGKEGMPQRGGRKHSTEPAGLPAPRQRPIPPHSSGRDRLAR